MLKCAPSGNVKQENNGSRSINILVHILMMAFFAWHVEVNNFVLVCIINVISCLFMKPLYSLNLLTLICSSDECSFSTTVPKVYEIASRNADFPTPESPTKAILNLK